MKDWTNSSWILQQDNLAVPKSCCKAEYRNDPTFRCNEGKPGYPDHSYAVDISVRLHFLVYYLIAESIDLWLLLFYIRNHTYFYMICWTFNPTQRTTTLQMAENTWNAFINVTVF